MVRKIGPFFATPLASVAERSAAARSRQHRVKRRVFYGCRATQSASSLVTRYGDDAILHMRSRAESGLASGDFETYALWLRRKRKAERLIQSRHTGPALRGGGS